MTNMEWLTEDDGGTVSFLSHDNISAGEVIYNNYGAKSNEELILGYGFFLRSRSLNALHLQLAVGSTSSSQHDRALRENYQFPPWYGRDMSCFLTADDPLPNPLITNVQMHCMSSIELYHFMTNIRAANDSHNHSNPVRQISILTKLHALQILSELLRTTKDRLATQQMCISKLHGEGPSLYSGRCSGDIEILSKIPIGNRECVAQGFDGIFPATKFPI